MLRVNPEVDRRLDGFMQANTKLTDYYTNSGQRNIPNAPIRAFMLDQDVQARGRIARQTARQAPQAKEWLDQQAPERETARSCERLEKINPFYREKALVRVIAHEKARLDFTPKPSSAKGCRSKMARREGRARREKSPAVPPLALGLAACPEKADCAAFLGNHRNLFHGNRSPSQCPL